MTRLGFQTAVHPLGRAEGGALLSAPQVILKAALESDREVSLIAGPRYEAFSAIFTAASEEASSSILRQHGVSIAAVPHASRAIALAAQAANSGRAAVALVPNAQLESCAAALASASAGALHHNGAMCALIEDDPRGAANSCPRQAAMDLNIPCVEPADLAELRDLLDYALRLSRVGASPVALIVHSTLLRAAQSLDVRPNRITSTVDLVLARRRRKPRWAETGAGRDVMRLARRMELNRARAMPNPGERVPVGFITVGPSDPAVAYIAEALDLHGRLPVLHLGMVNPLDEAAVSRLLARCERAIVLEPRPSPGAVESAVLNIAERMRRRGGTGERPATVWGRELPPDAEGRAHGMETDEALHPSTLARRLIHLLHAVRPTMQVAQRLAPEPPAPQAVMAVPQRGADIGTPAALAVLRRMAADVDQWLRGQTSQLKDRGLEPTALAIDGVEPAGSSAAIRIVPVEFFSGRAFQDAGVAAVRQATRAGRPWIIFVCDFDVADHQDVERLTRGVIPGERAEWATIALANLNDRPLLRSRLEEAALGSGLTIVIVRDGSPPKYDVSAVERALAEIDRYGFQPMQRLIWPADQACMFTSPAENEENEPEHEAMLDAEAVRTEVTVDRFTSAKRGRARLRVQPMLEQIDVIRTKPPAWAWKSAVSAQGAAARLELPTPVHRKQPAWRAHVAGFRGPAPGAAAMVLQDAGHIMGYDVASIHDPSPIGPGRRAWSQIVFTRSRPPESANATAGSAVRHSLAAESRPPAARRIVAAAPYGEVDLLVGFDVQETLRAISPTEPLRVADQARTSTVANCGAFTEEEDRELTPAMHEAFAASLAAVSRGGHCVIEDFAAASRVWFYTDRVADVVMLGVAFQRGLIPVSLEAIEAAVARVEERGFGRSGEAFTFGRHLAASGRSLTKPREERDDDLPTMVRRLALGLRAGRWGGSQAAARFEGLVQRSLAAMPGLGETAPGRAAQRDFVTAVYRAIEWGGFEYATRYADAITSLYHVDRGETGRSLTRCAVLPLADAMLIHDAIYIATMATNPEQRRRLRQRLNVKHARGDRIERRYLTRVELAMFNRRFRADLRTSDWPARLARMLRHTTPSKWRGSRRERDIREFIVSFVQRAAYAAKVDYDRWNEAMHRLHLQAAENRLRGMALAELRMLAGIAEGE